jgi:hypothetical protein
MGSQLDLGAVPLNPVLGQVKGWVFTTTGAPATGAVVSSDDGYEVTVVDTEGRFTIRVLEGDRVVNVVLAAHDPWVSSSLEVNAWSEVNLEQPVFLPPYPGTLIGQVGLRQYTTPARANRIEMTLKPMDIEMVTGVMEPDEEAEPANPNSMAPSMEGLFRDTREERRDFIRDAETGVFNLNEVEPGSYMLEIRALGYEAQKWPVIIHPGAPTALGKLDLAHGSTGSSAVDFSGRVRTGGVGLVAVGLHLYIESPDGSAPLQYARVVTDSNGEFVVPASTEEWYSVRAQVTGFPEINEGPFRYIPGQGFRSPSGGAPDFNLGQAGP